ncbi:GIY-YIG nuclease family protein [Georgenia subflava]|uniref:GIY-YIG nuclease family protein n=1 Tax=Georgenia subflava TaxID=1622177 RepID=UPI00386026D6
MVARRLISAGATAARGVADVAIPADPGLYAWWSRPGVLPDLLHGSDGPTIHPEGNLELLYVGIANRSLRRRVNGNHLGRQTGSSTLRRALASWIGETEGWEREWRAGRQQLTVRSEVGLTAWMIEHLWLTWAEHSSPRDAETDVIRLLRPPLNRANNSSHPNYVELRRRRQVWRSGGTTIV